MLNEKGMFAIVRREGEVGAGKLLPFPQTTPEHDVIYIPPGIDPAQVGTLIIRGDSLVGAGLIDGDTAICKKIFKKSDIKRDTICVVYIPVTGELVVKRVAFREGAIALISANSNHAERYFEPHEIDIRGIVIGYQRMAEASGRFPSYDPDIPF